MNNKNISESKLVSETNNNLIDIEKITYELSESSNKASYGKKIIEALSAKLTNEFGGGFSPVSIRRMRRFYEM